MGSQQAATSVLDDPEADDAVVEEEIRALVESEGISEEEARRQVKAAQPAEGMEREPNKRGPNKGQRPEGAKEKSPRERASKPITDFLLLRSSSPTKFQTLVAEVFREIEDCQGKIEDNRFEISTTSLGKLFVCAITYKIVPKYIGRVRVLAKRMQESANQ